MSLWVGNVDIASGLGLARFYAALGQPMLTSREICPTSTSGQSTANPWAGPCLPSPPSTGLTQLTYIVGPGSFCLVQFSRHHVGFPIKAAGLTHAAAVAFRQLRWPVTRFSCSSQRKESRVREPERVTRSQRGCCNADGSSRAEACYSFRWNRGCVASMNVIYTY